MNYKKSYIGKGTQVDKIDAVRITLKVEDALALTHKWEGVEYLTFEVAKMQKPDDYGRTHTCYVSVREEDAVPEPAPAKKGRKAKKEEPVLETADEELPF